jgi:protoporphyrin/coproporphyrin ferrochelatase
MSFLHPEPPYQHGTPDRTAVVLINLGTPDAPTPAALRRYLKQFLWDRRVVEIPRALWWAILNGIILNLRPKKSAAKYATVWTPEGSPLRVHTAKQATLLRGYLGNAGHAVEVEYAMRYGSPSIAEVIEKLRARNCRRILLLPMYPQYAGSTSATALDDAYAHLRHVRNQPEIRTVRSFPGNPGYIAALAASVREHWSVHGRPYSNYRLVLSFHGVPKFTLDKGDPYFCECHKTARLVGEALEIKPEQVLVSFQSRFGSAEWLQPYTAPTLVKLARDGVSRVDVMCPGFVADCLETLEEIAMEVKADFLGAGGKEFHYLPCLNERPDWIQALASLVRLHMQGWPTDRESVKKLAAAAGTSEERAWAVGARF